MLRLLNLNIMNSILKLSKTKLPIRCKLAFVELCRAQSKIYPRLEGEGGAKLSAARFMKEAAREKLIRLGFKKGYLDSIS
jgi:hypothetical protein